MSRQNKKLHSAVALQALDFLLRMEFFYCLLLTGFYVQSGMGYGAFEPVRYVGILLIFAVLYVVSHVFRRLGAIVGIDLAAVVLSLYLFPLSYSKAWLAIALFLFVLIDLLVKGEPGDYGRTIVWSAENAVWWGAGIVALLAVSMVIGSDRSAESQTTCTHIELVLLGVFVLLYFLQRYVYMLYEHYHKAKKLDAADRTHVKRALSFAAVVGTGLTLLIFAFSGVLAQLVTFIIDLFRGDDVSISGGTIQTAEPYNTTNSISGISGNGNASAVRSGGGFSLSFSNEIVKVLALAAILLALLALYRFLRRGRYVQEETDDVVTVINHKERTPSAPVRVVQQLWYGNSNNEQIRRLFRQLVRDRLSKKNVRIQNLTADELTNLLCRAGIARADALEAGALYAYARYSGRQATSEQVRRMRSLCKTRRQGTEQEI